MAHPTLGEDIAAAVVARDGNTLTEVDLRDFAFQHLPDFKVRSRVVVVQAIPKGPTGKLQKMDLADRLAQELDPGKKLLPASSSTCRARFFRRSSR